MKFNFVKWQACGNDFVLVNAFHNEDVSEIRDNAEKICDRHFGAGADGVSPLKAIKTERSTKEFRSRACGRSDRRAGPIFLFGAKGGAGLSKTERADILQRFYERGYRRY